MAFGDIRVAQRADWLIDRIARQGTLVLRRLGETRAGEMAAHGFLSSPYVSVEGIVDLAAHRTAESCAGRHVLAVQDTSEINFSGRAGKRRGFGPGGDGETPGFFLHPVIAVDVESEAVLGLIDAQIWTRGEGRAKARRDRVFEDKESARWQKGCEAAGAVLKQAAAVTMVADRESDIYPLFARRPERLHLIVRAAHDRALAEGGRVTGALAEEAALGTTAVRVAPRRPGQRERTAEVALRAGTVRLKRPGHNRLDALPEEVALTLVEAREIAPPEGEAGLHWRLYTTHGVARFEEADAIVQLYRLRWRIEQTFRVLKSDGLKLDDSQLVEPGRLFNLAALGLIAAVRIIQLVDARDGSPRPISDVIDDSCAPALARISKKLEGKTARQKNPHPQASLAFVAWIAARLGGWNCYYKPPGPKTMKIGWDRLAAMLEGYALANHGENP